MTPKVLYKRCRFDNNRQKLLKYRWCVCSSGHFSNKFFVPSSLVSFCLREISPFLVHGFADGWTRDGFGRDYCDLRGFWCRRVDWRDSRQSSMRCLCRFFNRTRRSCPWRLASLSAWYKCLIVGKNILIFVNLNYATPNSFFILICSCFWWTKFIFISSFVGFIIKLVSVWLYSRASCSYLCWVWVFSFCRFIFFLTTKSWQIL